MRRSAPRSLIPAPFTALTVVAPRDDAFQAWLARVADNTGKSYLGDLREFLRWRRGDEGKVTTEEIRDAILDLVSKSKAEVEPEILRFLRDAHDRGLSPATVRHRRSALRSAIGTYKRLGLIGWELDAELPKGLERRKRRQTKGPSFDALLAMRRVASEHSNPLKAARDVAMLGLMALLRVRVSEVCNATLDGYHDGTIALMLKGRAELADVELPEVISRDIDAYLELRGAMKDDAPLFVSLDPGSAGKPLTRVGIYGIVRELAELAGVPGPVSPHRLLHTSSTALADAGVSTDDLQAWGRWEKRETAEAYIDSSKRTAERLADHLAQRWEGGK